MTENEAVFNILSKIKPYLEDDSDISPREVSFKLANQRALLLRNELNRNRSIDPDIIQDLGCVAMELADPAECCDVSTGCKVLRTVLEIPTTIELYNDITLTRIGPVDKTKKEFSRTTLSGAKWVGNGKYTKNEIYAYTANNRVYLVSNTDNHKFIENINIRGVFENPADVIPFTNCSTGSSCYSADDKYPLKAWMYNYIEGQVVKEYVQLYNLPADILNDGGDNTVTKQS
jgi:hypothetical protein